MARKTKDAPLEEHQEINLNEGSAGTEEIAETPLSETSTLPMYIGDNLSLEGLDDLVDASKEPKETLAEDAPTEPTDDVLPNHSTEILQEKQTVPPKKAPRKGAATKADSKKTTPQKAPKAPVIKKPPSDETINSIPESPPPVRARSLKILTIEAMSSDIEMPDDEEDYVWHEIRNAHINRKILSGTISGLETLENGRSIVVVDYKGFRVVIPMSEMMITLRDEQVTNDNTLLRQAKIAGNMLGAQIDFAIKGLDVKTRSAVATRKAAMLKKRQVFYMSPEADGNYRVREGRVVQARIIAVAEKVVRVEVFGVESSIKARYLSWGWLGDARERFFVGDELLVRVVEVLNRDSLEDISIVLEARSLTENTSLKALESCKVQARYSGKVTDVRKGVVFIRLSNNANAIAHSCNDRRRPGKNDDVSFVVTNIDWEQEVALGIITRIIKQNL